jgi:outer membrane protein TolC
MRDPGRFFLFATALWAGTLASFAPAAADEARTLTFHDAITAAASGNPAVTLAQLRQHEADARVTQARSVFLPSVTGTASMADRTFNVVAQGISFKLPNGAAFGPLIGPIGLVDARAKVTQPIVDLSDWQRLRASRYGVQSARAEASLAAEGASQSAALAYLRAARAEALVHARESDLGLAEDLRTLAEAQLSAGTSPAIDATRARTQVSVQRGALVMAKNMRDRAHIDLARALGVDPGVTLALADSLDATLGDAGVPAETDAAVRFAMEHRLELMQEEAKLAKAKAEKAATQAERLPRVDAAADWGQSGQHWGDAIYTRQYALSLSVPVFDGGRREGRLSEQEDVVRESQVRAKDLRDQVAGDVRAALLDLASGVEQVSVARERLELAQAEVTQATDRFTSGVAGNIEVIEAQSSLLRARDADIDARFAVANARIALARAAGVARQMR